MTELGRVKSLIKAPGIWQQNSSSCRLKESSGCCQASHARRFSQMWSRSILLQMWAWVDSEHPVNDLLVWIQAPSLRYLMRRSIVSWDLDTQRKFQPIPSWSTCVTDSNAFQIRNNDAPFQSAGKCELIPKVRELCKCWLPFWLPASLFWRAFFLLLSYFVWLQLPFSLPPPAQIVLGLYLKDPECMHGKIKLSFL